MVCYVVPYNRKNVANPNLVRVPSDVNEFLFTQGNIGGFHVRTGRKYQAKPHRWSTVMNYLPNPARLIVNVRKSDELRLNILVLIVIIVLDKVCTLFLKYNYGFHWRSSCIFPSACGGGGTTVPSFAMSLPCVYSLWFTKS